MGQAGSAWKLTVYITHEYKALLGQSHPLLTQQVCFEAPACAKSSAYKTRVHP